MWPTAALRATGEKLAADLEAAGLDVLLDDSDERAGVKFKDADLVGIPYRINVGKKAAAGQVELVTRATSSSVDVALGEVVALVKKRVEEEWLLEGEHSSSSLSSAVCATGCGTEPLVRVIEAKASGNRSQLAEESANGVEVRIARPARANLRSRILLVLLGGRCSWCALVGVCDFHLFLLQVRRALWTSG